jgi:type III pantothenate kinase
MILAIDIGNTNIDVGIFNVHDKEEHTLLNNFRLHTELNVTVDEFGSLVKSVLSNNHINASKIKGIICSNVASPLNKIVMGASQKYFSCDCMFVAHDIVTGLVFDYDVPSNIGADRIVNAVCVNTLYKGNSIIIDFGTATTFCVLTDKSEYLGGLILPGIATSLNALTNKAFKLPKLDLSHPTRVIGKSTHEGMLSGIYHGTMGILEGVVREIKHELNRDKVTVLATGGLSSYVDKAKCIDHIDPHLTLKGLNILYHLNNR